MGVGGYSFCFAESIDMVASPHPSSEQTSDVHACLLVLILKAAVSLSPRSTSVHVPVSSSEVDSSSFLEHWPH